MKTNARSAAATTKANARKAVSSAKNIMHRPKAFGIAELVVACIVVVLLQVYDPFGIGEHYPGVMAALGLVALFYLVGAYYFVRIRALEHLDIPMKAFLGKMTFLMGAVVVFALFGLGFGWFTVSAPGVGTVLKYVLLALSVGVASGILYLLARPFLGMGFGSRSKLGALRAAVLYVPCLFVELAEFARRQWAITTRPIWLLLGAEVALVAIFYLGPKLYGWFVSMWGTKLLRGPHYLSKEQTLGTFEQLHPGAGTEDPDFKYHYAISSWFNINPQPPGTRPAFTKDTTILNYAGKPNITYNMTDERLRVMADTGKGPVEVADEREVPLQKWNNIVVNYVGGTMDVFLNGELVGSRGGIAPYMTFESIRAGSPRGLEGGICNVVYFDKPLTSSEIKTSYNLLRLRSPPVL